MNAALVNAIAETWVETDGVGSGRRIGMQTATAAVEAVADFVAALPHGYTAPDVLAAIRGEDVSPDKGRVYVSDSPLLDRIAAEERGDGWQSAGWER